MNLKILFILIIYYSVFIGIFATAGDKLVGVTTNINLDDSALQPDEKDVGGVFNTGVSFKRFFIFTTFGIGLPSSTPTWAVLFFAIWQTLILILGIGFVLDSIWGG